jgi:hypothetical protein
MLRTLTFIVGFMFILPYGLSAQSEYHTEVEFFPEDAKMFGYSVSPEHFLRGYSKITNIEQPDGKPVFHLHGECRVDSAFYNGIPLETETEKVKFYYNYSLLALKIIPKNISLKPSDTVEIYYSGFMHPSKARSLSDYMHISKENGVFLRSYGYSLWFPVWEHAEDIRYKADFKSIKIRMPSDFRAVVAGKLVSEQITDKYYVSEWQPGLQRITDIQCTAQRFKTESQNNVSVYYLQDKHAAEDILNYSLRLKSFFEKQFKSPPTEAELFIAEMPKYGNISAANTIGLASDLFNSFTKNIHAKSTIAHELLHPYLLINTDYDNRIAALVYEGFPSFFQVYALSKTIPDSIYSVKKVMNSTQKNYLKKRETGLTMRGSKLPPEKAVLDISFDEIGAYKDNFVLSDRVWLFFYFLWRQMGDKQFDAFVKALFQLDTIDYAIFRDLIQDYLPESEADMNIWLNTTEFPAKFRI